MYQQRTEGDTPTQQTTESFFDKDHSVASMTECTGLVRTPPDTESEVDSYTDIYDINLAPSLSGAKKSKRQH